MGRGGRVVPRTAAGTVRGAFFCWSALPPLDERRDETETGTGRTSGSGWASAGWVDWLGWQAGRLAGWQASKQADKQSKQSRQAKRKQDRLGPKAGWERGGVSVTEDQGGGTSSTVPTQRATMEGEEVRSG